jgi:hypothetical protein
VPTSDSTLHNWRLEKLLKSIRILRYRFFVSLLTTHKIELPNNFKSEVSVIL